MNGIFRSPDCADQPTRRAMTIKASQRATLDARNFCVEGVAREMRLDPATLRRYLSDTYKSCMPVDMVHPWFCATEGDLEPGPPTASSLWLRAAPFMGGPRACERFAPTGR